MITQTQTQRPKIEMSTLGYLIKIEGEDGRIIKVETTPYLGKLYTSITYTSVDDMCMPRFRAIVAPWVWRRIKRMVLNGTDIRQIDAFAFYAVKDFVLINMSDKHFEDGYNHHRIYYEEPYRLLAHFFSSSHHQPPPEKQNLNKPPRVFKCACKKP